MNNIKHVHLTAICGMGMGAFAGLLQSAGYYVTGSDQNVYPPMSTQLESMGIKLMSPYSPENLSERPDLVIVGNAIRRNNPEIVAVMERSIPYLSFPAALGQLFLENKKSLVVAGTHGKTTTCSILAWLLDGLGLDPSFLIGGILNNFHSSYKSGTGDYFVVEGDEYDTAFFDKGPKFMHYRPFGAIITSVEFDHGDIYRDIDHIKSAFSKFIALIPKDGVLIACGDYPHLTDILHNANCKVQSYGLNGGADWSLKDLVADENGSSFKILFDGEEMGSFKIPLLGRHNASNFLATAALLHNLGVDIKALAEIITKFQGIKRRQEVRGVEHGITVIDDFAHHPTKVRETVAAVRSKYPNGNLWAIFEPRTNSSRRAFFQKDYLKSFDPASQVVVAGVFNMEQIPEEERFDPERLVRELKEQGKEAYYIPDTAKIIELIAENAVSGDTILIMSNGGFESIHERLLQRLKTL